MFLLACRLNAKVKGYTFHFTIERSSNIDYQNTSTLIYISIIHSFNSFINSVSSHGIPFYK